MARLALVVGFPDSKPDAEPALVYLGRSGAKMRDAIAASPWPRHLEVAHLEGIPKNNPAAASNLAALVKKKK